MNALIEGEKEKIIESMHKIERRKKERERERGMDITEK